MKRIVKIIALGLVCINCIAQTSDYNPKTLILPASGQALKLAYVAPTPAGHFNLFFTDATGTGFNHGTLGAARRAVAIQVFTDLSALLVPAQQAYGLGNMPFVNILVSQRATSVTGVLGTGAPYWDTRSPGIMDAVAALTFNGGFDYVKNFSAYDVSNGQNITTIPYNGHGDLEIDFAQYTFYTGFSNTVPAGQYDLYSIMLHEAIHILGFGSEITSTGAPVNSPGRYTRYDDFLYKTSTNTKVISNPNPACINNALTFGVNSSDLVPPSCNIMFRGTTNKQVNTSNTPFAFGTSLSHFDVGCAGGADPTSVMQSGIGAATARRHPSQDEKNILCDLGFKTTNSYGTGSPFTGAQFTYTGSCNKRVCGVNDYFYFNTAANTIATQYNVVQGNSILISDVLLNDDDNGAIPLSLTCVSVLQGGGTATGSGNTITYTPASNYTGEAVLTYIPVGVGGTKGNITYVHIHVESNYPCNTTTACEPNANCNLICDAGFESYTTGSPMLLDPPKILSDFRIDWQNSPDVYVNPPSNCNWPGTGPNSICYGYQQCGWSGTTPTDRNYPTCKNYIGMVNWTEGIMLKTKSPLLMGKTYTISLWARSACGTGQLLISASNQRPCYNTSTSLTAPSTDCGGFTFIPQSVGSTGVAIPSTAWTQYSFNYTPTSSDKNYIIIYTNSTPGTSYCYFDDVKVAEVPKFDQLPMVCSGSQAVTLRASPLGGTFSGTGVTGNTFVPPVVSTATTYTLTYTTSCGTSATQTITVSVGSCPCGSNFPASISSTATYANQSLNVTGNSTISGFGTVVTLNHCNLSIAANATITVSSLATLVINNVSHLHACTNMWNGIVVNAGGTLIVNNSLIEDAKLAIKSVGGAAFTLENDSRLNKNYKGILYEEFAYTHPSIIKNTTISCLDANGNPGNVLKPPYSGLRSVRGIEINTVGHVDIGVAQGGQGNTFNNLGEGIFSVGTDLVAYNNSFTNITAIGSYTGSGIRSTNGTPTKNLTIGGSGINQANTFTNSTVGVNAQGNQVINVITNKFNNLTTGVKIYNNTNFGNNIVVNNNTIDDCTTGIYALDVGAWDYWAGWNTFTANNNLINQAAPGGNSKPNSTGIRVLNGVLNMFDAYDPIYYMDNNIIKRVSNGIWITNLNGFEIKSNAITNLSVLGSSVMQNGILAEGSRGGGYNIGIWSNFVQASSLYDWFQSGIRLETTVSTVAYNTVQDIGRGLFFGSVCTGTETAKNNMINNYSGIFLNWGVIGAQLSGQRATENSWHGTFPESHLFSLSSNGSQSPMYVYKTIPQCDPTLAPCTDPVNIRSVFSGSGAVQIPVFESTIVSGYKMSDPKRELYLKIAKDEFHFPMYDASARWMSKYNVYNKLQAEDSIYKVDEPELKWFADSVTASTMGELHKAAKELANNNDNSLTILNSVAPGNIVEQNLKDVYELVLSGRSNGNSFSKAQIKKLQSIAAQCPYEGGYGVYCARVLLAPLDNRVYNICESGRITKSGLKLAPSDTSMINNIMVYPNPANDILNVAIHLEDGQTGVLTVYDLTGKIALSSMLTNSNISEISTALLSEGLYIYKIIVNDIPLSTGKLSIIR